MVVQHLHTLKLTEMHAFCVMSGLPNFFFKKCIHLWKVCHFSIVVFVGIKVNQKWP